MGLRRELGLLDATMVTVGGIIGSGIIFVPNAVAAQSPDAAGILALWVLGGLVSLAGALSVAELAAMHPRAGGPYVFVREAFGPVAGFVAGWTYFVLGKAAIAAAVMLVFSEHVAFFLGLAPLGKQLLALWGLAALTFINALGVKQGARTMNALTLLKAGGLVVLVAAVLLLAPRAPPQAAPATVGSVSTALLLVLFAYNAWINATFLAEEVKRPERTLPRALALGTLGVMAVYLLANVAYLHALGPSGMAASSLVAAESMQRAVPWGAAFIAATVIVSTLGNSNGGVLTAARIPFAMAQRGELPGWLGRTNRKGAPDTALLAHLVLAAAFLLTGTFQAAATLGILAIWSVLVMVALAVFVQRRRAPDAPRTYRVPLYPLLPGAFLAGALLVVGVRAVQDPLQAVLAALLMLGGLPLFAWQRRRVGPHIQEPLAKPGEP